MKCSVRNCKGTYKLINQWVGTEMYCVVEYDEDGERYTIDRAVPSVRVRYQCDTCGDEFEDGAP